MGCGTCALATGGPGLCKFGLPGMNSWGCPGRLLSPTGQKDKQDAKKHGILDKLKSIFK